MATIGDKKVSLALQDGSSINLNKPKVLPASITKIADIKEPGWYIGGTVAGTAPQSLEDESKPVATTADSDNGIAAQSNESDSIFKLYDDSEINYVITDAPFENLLTSKIFILYVYPIISKSTGSNAVDGNDPDISGFGYLLMTRYGNLHIGTRTTNAEVITWDQIATRHDINHIIEYFQQYYIIDNLISTNTDKALSANQGKVLKDLVDKKLGPDDVVTHMSTVLSENNNLDFDTLATGIYRVAFSDDSAWTDTEKHHPLSGDSTQYGALIVMVYDDNIAEQIYLSHAPSNTIYCRHRGGLNDTWSDWTSIANQKSVDTKMNTPIYSSTDLTPGTSDLADGQIYIVYYN